MSIASYCDPLLGFTIERALANARNPDALHFGIVEQAATATTVKGKASYVRIDPEQARGPCWARAIAMSFYRGEDWFAQLDSHMDFAAGWDERLIDQARSLKAGQRVALTTYPSAFVFEDGKPVPKPITQRVLACVLKPGMAFAPDHPVLKFEAHPVEIDVPLPGFHVGAGCLFASGAFALEIPYDPAFYFHGEEQGVALRLFTRGWDIYHPPGMPIYHLYSDQSTGAPPRQMHWDAAADDKRAVKWGELEVRSRQRLAALVSGAPLGAYGLGVARSVADFAVFSGIDYARRVVDARAFRPRPPPRPEYTISMSAATTTKERGKWSG